MPILAGPTSPALDRAPDCEPPADLATPATRPRHTSGPPAAPPAAAPQRGTRRAAAPGESGPPVQAGRADPALYRDVSAVLRVALEVVDRRRGPRALAPRCTPGVLDALLALRRRECPRRLLGPARIRTIRLVADGRGHELCGTYGRGGRIFALAGRLEQHHGRPHLTALAFL